MADSFVIIASLTVAKLDWSGNAIVAIISKIFVSSLINDRRDFDFVGIKSLHIKDARIECLPAPGRFKRIVL